jgi:hypothetical protein
MEIPQWIEDLPPVGSSVGERGHCYIQLDHQRNLIICALEKLPA